MLIADLISSDESADEEGRPVLVVRELGWRSDKVTKFFERLDEGHENRKSEQAKRQTKGRVRNGKISSRQMPQNLPHWAVRND